MGKKAKRRRVALEKAVLRDNLMKQYQRDPERWFVERFGLPRTSLRWDAWPGYEGHTWDGSPNPFLQMFEAVVQREWVAIESATSTGKTYMLAPLVYWFLDCFPNSLVVSTAPKENQLKTILWAEVSKQFKRFKALRPQASMFNLRLLPGGAGQAGTGAEADAWQAIGVVAGVGAGEESATKMQGFHRENMLIIVEEAAGVPAPVFTAIKNTCTGSNNLIVAVGNPDAVTDSLHEFAILPKVRHLVISAYDHPNVVTGRDSLIPGAVSVESIDRRKLEYGEESMFFKSRVRGIAPEQGVDSLIRAEWLRAAAPSLPENAGNLTMQLLKSAGYPAPAGDRSRDALGLDVANSENGDAAAEAWGRGWLLTHLREFPCPNANDLAYNVLHDDVWLQQHGHLVYGTQKLANHPGIRAANIGVDAVGVGVGTVNAFTTLGLKVKALQGGQVEEAIPKDKEDKPLYKFANLRSQMYYTFREELQRGEICFGDLNPAVLRKLFRELVVIRFATHAGTTAVERKENIKKRLSGKSPNMADAVVYWNWMRKRRETSGGALPFM